MTYVTLTPTEFVQTMRERYETGSQFQIADRIVQLEDLRTAVTIIEQLQGDVQKGAESLLRAVEVAERLAEQDEPHLGLATTWQLLDELRARIEVDYYNGGGGLQYTTKDGRPDDGLDVWPEQHEPDMYARAVSPGPVTANLEEGNDGVFHPQTYHEDAAFIGEPGTHPQGYRSQHEAEAAWLDDDLPDWRVI